MNSFRLWARPAFSGAVLGALLAWGTQVKGAILTNVTVGDNFFSPQNVSIRAGDKVKWTWIGSVGHSTTSNSGLWNSSVHSTGFSFTNTFNSAGSFPYHCTIHSFQTGTIAVQPSASSPPTVSITQPSEGAVFASPASFTLSADAGDLDGSIVSVEFFVGSTSLGKLTTSPFTVNLTNLAAGAYTLSAVAADNSGLRATNRISIVVNAPATNFPPVQLSSPAWFGGTNFQFSFSANPGATYVILRSIDLVAWTAIGTNLAGADSVVFQDTNPSPSQDFYRVGLLSNP